MRRTLTWFVLCFATIMVAALYRNIWATPVNAGFTNTTVAVGRFGEIDATSPHLKPEEYKRDIWFSRQKTQGSSDLYVQSNVWQPGGSTGWHTHPGHSLIIVTAGTVTSYEANDPECKPHVYTQGMGFVDPGGDHVHILRNETDAVAKTIAVQLIPAASTIRIDAGDPGNCHFQAF